VKRLAVGLLCGVLVIELVVGGTMLVQELTDGKSDAAELPGPLLSEAADEAPDQQQSSAEPGETTINNPAADQPEVEDVSEAVVALVNDFRVAGGQPPLYVDPALSAAASTYCGVIAPLQWREHIGPEGEGPDGRAAAAGYEGLGIVENLAWGYASPEEVATAWQTAPDERNNLLNSLVNGIGVAHCFVAEGDYQDWWVFMAGIGAEN
jgi:uncharacterized protein YkwD